jgi:hypothetical protein
MLRRVAVIGAGLFAVWLVLLVILSFALSSRQERKTRERLAESLQAEVTLGDVDLALVRGRMTLDKLSIKRVDTIGHMIVDVGGVRCELAPLGIAIFDHDCRELVVRDVRIEVSTAALFKVQRPPKRAPIRTDRMVIDNATLVFLPSAFMPNLGKIEIGIERAETGATVMRTPLSWLFSLKELRARFDLPAGITVRIGYKNGMVTASGSVFGSEPIELPLQIPAADTMKDAHEEVQQLVKLGKQIAEQLVAKRAEDWLRSKLP